LTYVWKLRDAILDALKDDGESIIQIFRYLDYLKIKFSTEMVKAELVRLLNDECVKIAYPYGLNSGEFENATDENISDFWFELTPKGENEWSLIGNR
jgi:hypothetical protein